MGLNINAFDRASGYTEGKVAMATGGNLQSKQTRVKLTMHVSTALWGESLEEPFHSRGPRLLSAVDK